MKRAFPLTTFNFNCMGCIPEKVRHNYRRRSMDNISPSRFVHQETKIWVNSLVLNSHHSCTRMFMCAQCQNTIADAYNFDVNQFFWTNYLSPSEYVQRMQMEQGGKRDSTELCMDSSQCRSPWHLSQHLSLWWHHNIQRDKENYLAGIANTENKQKMIRGG